MGILLWTLVGIILIGTLTSSNLNVEIISIGSVAIFLKGLAAFMGVKRLSEGIKKPTLPGGPVPEHH